MSQERVTARQGEAGRDVLDRVLLRTQPLTGLVAAGVLRLDPGSALRKRLINLTVKRGFAALARSDVTASMLAYEPDAEVWMTGMSGVGLDGCYRGHEGVRALYADMDEAWDKWEWTIRAVVDGRDRIAVEGDFVGHGRGSGIQFALSGGGTAFKLSPRGKVAWQEWFVGNGGWKRALEAVGLRE